LNYQDFLTRTKSNIILSGQNDLPLQEEFAQRVIEIRELEIAQAASRGRLGDLFQSLIHRAFIGEL
jgi:hypothetical protein